MFTSTTSGPSTVSAISKEWYRMAAKRRAQASLTVRNSSQCGRASPNRGAPVSGCLLSSSSSSPLPSKTQEKVIPEHGWRRYFLVGAKRPDALVNNSKCPWSSESITLQKIVNDPFVFSQSLPCMVAAFGCNFPMLPVRNEALLFLNGISFIIVKLEQKIIRRGPRPRSQISLAI